jgi:hypothetical protein
MDDFTKRTQAEDTLGTRKKKSVITDPRSVTLSKLDIAAEHIRAAVRLFFEDAHPAPIYLLAASAREITQAIGDKLGVRTILTNVAEDHGVSRKELIDDAHRYAGFMKHADRKPNSEIELSYSFVEMVLQIACHDFGRVAGGMPIEAQVYEAWIFATVTEKISAAPLNRQRAIKRAIAKFPGVRSADVVTRRKIGREALETALKDPSLQMKFRRTIDS